MKFEEGIKEMLKGNKITTISMAKNVYLFIKNNKIMHRGACQSEEDYTEIYCSYLQDILVGCYKDEEWKVVEEKKTLSDKIVWFNQDTAEPSPRGFYLKDVKQFIKDIIDFIEGESFAPPNKEGRSNKIKELAGDRLV